MEAIGSHLIDILITFGTTTVLGLIGFVWRISHKVSELEKSIETAKEVSRRDFQEVKKDIDVIYENVDKNREWTTNRMMSIAKDMRG
tara:strand:+ start:586 stop:846 length:261 start_codon:yes stop_codon:yes gene_type:complete